MEVEIAQSNDGNIQTFQLNERRVDVKIRSVGSDSRVIWFHARLGIPAQIKLSGWLVI